MVENLRSIEPLRLYHIHNIEAWRRATNSLYDTLEVLETYDQVQNQVESIHDRQLSEFLFYYRSEVQDGVLIAIATRIHPKIPRDQVLLMALRGEVQVNDGYLLDVTTSRPASKHWIWKNYERV